MAFRRQMHDRIGLVLDQNTVQRRTVADVGLFEGVERRTRH